MNIEEIYRQGHFGGQEILVTDKRLRIGSRTFSLPHVTFVDLKTVAWRRNIVLWLILGSFGGFMVLRDSFFTLQISSEFKFLCFLLFLISVGYIFFFGRTQFRYLVRIGTGSQVIETFSTTRLEEAAALIEDINQALANRLQKVETI